MHTETIHQSRGNAAPVSAHSRLLRYIAATIWQSAKTRAPRNDRIVKSEMTMQTDVS